MSAQDLLTFAAELRQELNEAILPWWWKFRDLKNGGFYGWIGNNGRVDKKHDKGVVMHSRFLWTYAAAYRFDGNEKHLEMARHAKDFLTGPLGDKTHGGFFWQVDHTGKPRFDRKVVYGQAFAIYALSEYARATHDRASLDLAIQTFNFLEKFARDPQFGGYFEACSQDWKTVLVSSLSDKDIACPKSMNTNLHVLEAYATLLPAIQEFKTATDNPAVEQVREALGSLVRVHVDKLRITPEHMTLYYETDWTPMSTAYSFGHDIEGTWLVTEAAEVAWGHHIPDDVKQAVLTMADKTVKVLKDYGPGLIYEQDGKHFHTYRDWWPQAESLVGLINAAELSGDLTFVDAAHDVWTYIKDKVKDKKNGEWFWKILDNGKPDKSQPKGGLWKTSYHNGRACMESIRRLEKLAKA